ncbi:MAG: hypothetical protein K0Q72_5132, partial [Armatimonadetes bacterium]|nr:hypothetical protein [Armatimonadota bacterium]
MACRCGSDAPIARKGTTPNT